MDIDFLINFLEYFKTGSGSAKEILIIYFNKGKYVAIVRYFVGEME